MLGSTKNRLASSVSTEQIDANPVFYALTSLKNLSSDPILAYSGKNSPEEQSNAL